MYKRFALIFAFFGISFSLLYMRIFYITQKDEYKQAASNQGSYTITVNKTYANIYDCNMVPLINRKDKYLAVINPTSENVIDILPYLKDRDFFYKQLESGNPFVCEVNSPEIDNNEILTFTTKIRTSSNQIAPHIVGYTIDNKGVTGIEKAYDSFLRSNFSSTKITYKVDGTGKMLDGTDEIIDLNDDTKAGVITTIDYDIQAICEAASKKFEKGAIVVMDPYTGDLKAVVSAPNFSPTDLAKSLNDKNTPFINRAFSAYNVGSIFKLVTAATALEQGISPDLKYECTGNIDIEGQIFRCHKHDGHGLIDMQSAMVESCNTYFINLSAMLNNSNFINTASALGFGKETVLADGIVSVKGNLQTERELFNPAEKANLAFGQGMLTATPVQISCLSSSIVNNGEYTKPKLIIGLTDGENITFNEEEKSFQAIEPMTAYKLRKFMTATVQDNEESVAKPYNTTAAGKTSTAQTGKYNEDENEILQAWFTGYFPVDNPKYVVTVLIEDGKSGNFSAGPVFKEIAENITRLGQKNN